MRANLAVPLARAAARYFAKVDATLARRSRLVEHVLGALCAVLGMGQDRMPELVDVNPAREDAKVALTDAACRIRLHHEVEGSAKREIPVDGFDVQKTLECVELLTNVMTGSRSLDTRLAAATVIGALRLGAPGRSVFAAADAMVHGSGIAAQRKLLHALLHTFAAESARAASLSRAKLLTMRAARGSASEAVRRRHEALEAEAHCLVCERRQATSIRRLDRACCAIVAQEVGSPTAAAKAARVKEAATAEAKVAEERTANAKQLLDSSAPDDVDGDGIVGRDEWRAWAEEVARARQLRASGTSSGGGGDGEPQLAPVFESGTRVNTHSHARGWVRSSCGAIERLPDKAAAFELSACSIRTSREGSSATTRGGPSARPRSRPRARTRSALMTARLSRSSRRTTCCASPSRWSSAPSSVRSCARTRRCARPLPRAPKRARRSRSRSAALRGARARVRRSLRRRSARSRASGSMWLAPWTSRQKLRWRRRAREDAAQLVLQALRTSVRAFLLSRRDHLPSRILATAEDAQGSRPIYRYIFDEEAGDAVDEEMMPHVVTLLQLVRWGLAGEPRRDVRVRRARAHSATSSTKSRTAATQTSWVMATRSCTSCSRPRSARSTASTTSCALRRRGYCSRSRRSRCARASCSRRGERESRSPRAVRARRSRKLRTMSRSLCPRQPARTAAARAQQRRTPPSNKSERESAGPSCRRRSATSSPSCARPACSGA